MALGTGARVRHGVTSARGSDSPAWVAGDFAFTAMVWLILIAAMVALLNFRQWLAQGIRSGAASFR